MISNCVVLLLETHLSLNWKMAHLLLPSFLWSDFTMRLPGASTEDYTDDELSFNTTSSKKNPI